MSECYNCGAEIYSEPIVGYLSGVRCKVCKNCAESSEEFVKAHYEISELFMRFQAQLREKYDLSSYRNELLVAKDLDEGIQLAREKYPEYELIGLLFDDYCTSNDVTLYYDCETDLWIPQI